MNKGGTPAGEPEPADSPQATSAHDGPGAAGTATDGVGADAEQPEQPEQPDGAQATADDLRERLAKAEDLRLRALADLDNVRKRCAVQVDRAAAEARAAVAAQWLPVVDNLDRALS